MKRSAAYILIIIFFIAFAGCSAGTENSDNDSLMAENSDLKAENEQLNENIDQLNLQIKDLQGTIDQLQNETESTTSPSPTEASVFIYARVIDPSGSKPWTSLSSFDFDYDMDGQDENITLFTSALRDDNGIIMWDDGQDWLLMIRDGSSFYPLFLKYIQLGGVFFYISKSDEQAIPTISVVTATGSGLIITDFTYNVDEEAYEAATAFDAGVVNRFFTSVPDYR